MGPIDAGIEPVKSRSVENPGTRRLPVPKTPNLPGLVALRHGSQAVH